TMTLRRTTHRRTHREANMATTTKAKKATRAKKQDRRLSYDAATAHLTITVDGEASGYWVDVVAVTDCGPPFELLKDRATRRPGAPTCYAVCVGAGAQDRYCECKGFEFRRTCRHVDAMACLLSRGHFQN